MNPHLILIVEDDSATRSFLADQLVADGYEILLAENRQHALHLLAEPPPTARARRHQRRHARPARRRAQRRGPRRRDRSAHSDDRADQPARTNSTACECSTAEATTSSAKPFSYPELRGRIRALLRRAYEPRRAPVTRVGALSIDQPRSREVGRGRAAGRASTRRSSSCCRLPGRGADPGVHQPGAAARRVALRGRPRSRTVDSHVISSTVSGVGCVGCGFRPGRRRRFISSGVDSALAAVLSPEGEARWRGRCAPCDTPSSS